MKKVSVIVPVFNNERTLQKCVDTIIQQTMDEIEIILVDDGSTDGSPLLCDEISNLHDNIKVIHKENGGLVSARKSGLKEATGEYVGYVDSDDWIEPQMYERLYGIAQNHDVDMVSSGYIFEGNYQSYEYDTVDEGEYRGIGLKELREKTIYNMQVQDLGLRGSLCCKLFRRENLKKAQLSIPDTISYSEDKACVLMFMLNCESVYVVKDCFYHYVLNKESMTMEPKKDYLVKINEVYKYFSSLYDHPNFSDDMRIQAELYITQQLIKGINSRMGFLLKNLLWIDSDWMYKIPEGSGILLFGSGALVETYSRQVKNSKRLKLIGILDDVHDVPDCSYDYIVITYKYVPKVEEIRNSLIDKGIPKDRIRWFEQKEIFWKYAKDAGLY
ncbi:glycosyltransferase family 2 protein [Oribacterium sp. NK2B42]|uniref:glycosyltransferase family 2 protein n=1 Tax=Oribacterium sp. NK2B42 TaxID=689781 RepID=UPI000418F516|nr:glycosyltransferase family 2 protein [Oribacterium sp. NK2B42]